ncbi:MAG: PRC-barrel domain-containing protein [Acetobacteraceae bacterium]
MKKLSTITAVAALALGLGAPIATHAQTGAMKDVMTGDQSMRSSKLINAAVYNDQGDKIGSIVDILVRSNGAEPVALVSVGDYIGGGTKLVAFPVSKLHLDGSKAMMQGATRAALAAMSNYTFLNTGG